MKEQFTPGPWLFNESNHFRHSVDVSQADYAPYISDSSDVCSINTTAISKERYLANANLIAAAPELYEALRNLIEIGKRDLSNPKYDGYFDAAIEALKKANP